MGITWNAVALPVSAPSRRVTRGLAAVAAVAAVVAVAPTGVSGLLDRGTVGGVASSGASAAPTGVGASPWFADAYTAPDGSPTLPSMTYVDRVIGAQRAWSLGGDGHGVDVAVLDSGVTPVAGLDTPGKVVYGPDLSFDSQNADRVYLDGYGHGTAMAGIIAGNDGVSGGFTGVAPKARIVSVKVGASNGAVDVSQVIAGIDWVVEHAHDNGLNIRVLNISLGTDSTQSYLLDPLAHAAENAWKHGIVVVAAVGNDGTSNRSVADPAMDPYVLAVGAEDPKGTVDQSDDVPSPFTSQGSWARHADVVAPGSYIVSLRVPGSTLDTAYPDARIGTRFFRGSGTSQATAVVSGAAADLLSYRPDLTNDQVKRLLMRTANSLDAATTLVGQGVTDDAQAAQAWVASATQSWTQSSGTGTLEGSRGTTHVSMNGQLLTGEKDIFGNPWNSATWSSAEAASATWSGGTYNSATWSGATWSSATWSSATWSSATWSGATWSSATWSSATWSGATWSSATWSSATWSGATWSTGSYN